MSAMRVTQGVSFPRSGHAAVYHVLRGYFGEHMVYCDPFSEKHCGCGQVPCTNSQRTFSKNHDFGLLTSPGVPVDKTERYLIQYRNPVRSIASNFQVYLKRHPDERHRDGWKRFAYREVFFWNRFVDKWVIDFPSDREASMVCTYESLLEHPAGRLRDILAWVSAEPLDEARAARTIAQFNIEARDNLKQFEFYDRAFFQELETLAAERLAELDLPGFESGV